MKLKLAFILICLVATFTIKAQDEEQPFDLGVIEDDVYRNNFFHFSLEIPNDWEAKIDKDQKLAKKSFDNLSDEHPGSTVWIDAARVKTAVLLIMSKYRKGSGLLNIILLVENISDFPSIKTGEDYLYRAMDMLEITSPKTKIKGKGYERHDFSKVFYSASLVTKMNGSKVTQKMFCTVVGDFVFLASCTYDTEEDLIEQSNIVSDIEFED